MNHDTIDPAHMEWMSKEIPDGIMDFVKSVNNRN
jgi:hypothetical protein